MRGYLRPILLAYLGLAALCLIFWQTGLISAESKIISLFFIITVFIAVEIVSELVLNLLHVKSSVAAFIKLMIQIALAMAIVFYI